MVIPRRHDQPTPANSIATSHSHASSRSTELRDADHQIPSTRGTRRETSRQRSRAGSHRACCGTVMRVAGQPIHVGRGMMPFMNTPDRRRMHADDASNSAPKSRSRNSRDDGPKRHGQDRCPAARADDMIPRFDYPADRRCRNLKDDEEPIKIVQEAPCDRKPFVPGSQSSSAVIPISLPRNNRGKTGRDREETGEIHC